MTRPSRSVLISLGVGVAAAVLTAVGSVEDPRRAMLGYIAAYGLVSATVTAAMLLTMVLVVVDSTWWLVVRRVFFAVVGTAPLLVVLFVPIGIGYAHVYPWASAPPDLTLEATEALEHQAAWHRPGFFFGRAAFYLATWAVLALLMARAERAHGGEPTLANARKKRALAAIGLPLVAFTYTFAAFDWFMSLAAGFTSNVFGAYVLTSGLVAALSVIAIGAWLAERKELAPGLKPDHVSAVGRLLLMAVILWAYIGFFQFVLAWIADIPAEASFYAARGRGVWAVSNVIIVVGRFFVPLLLLLSRSLKQSVRKLASVAIWLVVTSVVEFSWLVYPSLGFAPSPVDLLPFVAVGCLFFACGGYLFTNAERSALPRDRETPPVPSEALRYRSP